MKILNSDKKISFKNLLAFLKESEIPYEITKTPHPQYMTGTEGDRGMEDLVLPQNAKIRTELNGVRRLAFSFEEEVFLIVKQEFAFCKLLIEFCKIFMERFVYFLQTMEEIEEYEYEDFDYSEEE